jgi:hypothetical protein
VIANPPYLGEKGHKEIFREIKQGQLGEFYQGKMDLFYFFFHLALNIAADDSQVAFITTNYFPTAYGAKKLRNDFKTRSIVRNMVNFNELKIFESALGQHNMITILEKAQAKTATATTSITQKQGIAKPEILQQLLNGNDPETLYCQVKQKDLYDGEENYIRLRGSYDLSEDPIQRILGKIKKQGISLGIMCRINNGIHSEADRLSAKKYNLRDDKKAQVGDGIYVLNKTNLADSKQISMILGSKKESKYLKPFFKNSDIYKWSTSKDTNKKIIYLNKQNDNINDMKIMSGKVWFATNYGIYTCSRDGKNWQHKLLPPGDYFSNWVRAFDANSDNIFIAGFTGLYTYSFQSNSFTAHDISLPDNYQTSYTNSIFATDTLVWIGTDDGVFRYDTSMPISNDSSFTYYSKSNGIPTTSDLVMCRSLYANQQGLWLGLDEYTSSYAPNYCQGGLFFYDTTWTKYDQTTGLPADGIHFIQEYNQKIYAGIYHYIDGVNFNGAGMLVMDLQDYSWEVLDASNWHISNDAVRSFYCTATDTIVGTDEGIYTNIVSLPGLKPYARPAWFSLRSVGNGDIEVQVDSVYRATLYELYASVDGINFTDTLYMDSRCDTITTLSRETCYYFKIAGKNDYGVGPACKDVLGVWVSDTENDILLIQGFDLNTVGNTYDYCIDHGGTIASIGYGFDAVSDEALFNTNINISDYSMIDWISGMDKYIFNQSEKNKIKSYLEEGGKLFISGAQIVDNVSVVNRDAVFYNTYLKAKWVSRDVQSYTIQPITQGLFNGIDSMSFDDGSHGIYNVFAPDGFRPIGGAKSCMLYSEKDSSLYGSSALQYTGTFAESESEAQLVYMGFPFESIYRDSLQNALMRCVLDYFGFEVTLTSIQNKFIPKSMTLEQNYPNPFNPKTAIAYQLSASSNVNLSILDMNGRKVATLVDESKTAGYHSVNWDASHYSSGIYLCRMKAGNFVDTKKMILMK